MQAETHAALLQFDGPLMRLTLPADALSVRQALHDLEASELFRALSEDTRQNARIVLAEVMNNIVEHAFAGQAGMITLVFDLHLADLGAGLRCEITDTGAPMPGLALPEGRAQPLDQIDSLPEGGFGWFLIRSLTEDLKYHHSSGVNHLTFRLCRAQSRA